MSTLDSLRFDASPPVLAPSLQSPATAEPSLEEEPRPRRIRSILVVEDDAVIRDFIRRILVNCGFEVDTTTNGEEGWEALNRRPYDLLLTDHEMPLLTGLNLIARLRQKAIALPVILMSGVITHGFASSESGNLPDAFLQKPFSIIALVTEIENQLLVNRA